MDRKLELSKAEQNRFNRRAVDREFAHIREPAMAGNNGSSSDYRRADNGQYTTPKYAEQHPRTTIKETRKK